MISESAINQLQAGRVSGEGRGMSEEPPAEDAADHGRAVHGGRGPHSGITDPPPAETAPITVDEPANAAPSPPPVEPLPTTVEVSSSSAQRSGRVKIRKRVRVRTLDAQREHRREQWEKVRNVLMIVALGVVGLIMIWFGLKMFVTDPPPPRASQISWPAAAAPLSRA